MLRHSRKGLKDLPNKMDLLKVLAKDEFIKYFKDTFKIGPVKSEIIYFRFKESNFSLDNIPGIGIKTQIGCDAQRITIENEMVTIE